MKTNYLVQKKYTNHMKLELVEGCICDSFEVDGKPIMDVTVKELKDIFKKVTDKINTIEISDENRYKLEHNLWNLVEDFADEYISDGEPCGCCGDYVTTSIMNL